MSTLCDALEWARFYDTGVAPERYRPIFLFGANPEVEEVIINQGGDGLRVFDDKLSKSLRPCRPWREGFDEVWQSKSPVWVACGVASTPQARRQATGRIRDALDGAKWTWTNVVASSAHVGLRADLGVGVLVLDQAYVGPLARIEDHAVLLPGARLYHGAVLGHHSILVGGSTVLGRAHVCSSSRICAGSVVLPSARIGPGATVGAGLTVARLGPDDDTPMG